MILTNRLFEREAPSKEAKSIYIFSEGVRRESDYFNYFVNIDSRINIEVYNLDDQEDNSPLGLLQIAEECILKTAENFNNKYDFRDGDEVWIVLDIDKDKNNSRVPQIDIIKRKCKEHKGWSLALSNPCFEVWLYYHLHPSKPTDMSEICKWWKILVNSEIDGGFDTRKHSIFIEKAISNAEENFELFEGKPDVGCTEVYNLGNSIVPLIKDKIKLALDQFEGLED